jgi:hypothetical protein
VANSADADSCYRDSRCEASVAGTDDAAAATLFTHLSHVARSFAAVWAAGCIAEDY